MPFEIVRNDITHMQVDAIVNTANPQPVIGAGVDAAIHEKAGPSLLMARQNIGPIPCGNAAITPAFRLQAKYVIHTVGPVWHGGKYGEEQLLRNCYDLSLALALEHHCDSIAFPLISTGYYGFPKDKALQIAISAFSEFLMEHEMHIFLVVFDHTSYKLSEKLFQGVATYIDRHYVDAQQIQFRHRYRREPAQIPMMREAAAAPLSLDEFILRKDAGFVEYLLELIKKSGHKNSTIYKRANISKQHFSKLINNPNATITKPVAVAFALALELDLAQTKELLKHAGLLLSESSLFDLIILYHIENKIYNVVQINCVLYEYDQSLLGS